MPCFWVIIVRPKFATSGRFVLLSYNLTALYAYKWVLGRTSCCYADNERSVRDTNYDVEDIAFHRTVAVTLGTLWGLFVTRYIFPFEARKELRDGISESVMHSAQVDVETACLPRRRRLLLNMGYFYQKVVERVSVGHKEVPRHATLDSEATLREVDERTPLLKSRNGPSLGLDADKSFVDMEMHLQVSLIKVRLTRQLSDAANQNSPAWRPARFFKARASAERPFPGAAIRRRAAELSEDARCAAFHADSGDKAGVLEDCAKGAHPADSCGKKSRCGKVSRI